MTDPTAIRILALMNLTNALAAACYALWIYMDPDKRSLLRKIGTVAALLSFVIAIKVVFKIYTGTW